MGCLMVEAVKGGCSFLSGERFGEVCLFRAGGNDIEDGWVV